MRRRLPLLVAALCLLAPAAAAAAVHVRAVDSAGYPRIRVTVVVDKPSATPPTLLENGRPVEGASAVNLGSTKSVVLAIDRSQSMRGKPLNTAIDAARAFADAKPASDQIAVSTFASQALPTTPFSPSTTDSDAALRSISVDGTPGTKMYDDLVLDVDALSHQPTAGKVIIVVTDGNETSSSATLDQVTAAARKAHVAIYVIGIESSLFSPGGLKQLASGTGGRYYAAASPGYLHQIYSTIADELARTWQVEYLTAARPGDTIAVTASVPGQGKVVASTAIAGVGTVAPSKGALPKSAFTTPGMLVLAAIVGLLVMLAFRLVFKKSRSEEMRRRIQPHVGQEKDKTKVKRKRERSGLVRGLFASTEHVLGKSKQWSSLSRLLERGDVPLKTVEFAYMILLFGFGVGFLASVMGLHGIFLLVAFAVGGLLPIAFVWRKARKRLAAFDEQLPDLLMAVAASLKAGHSFKQGIQTIVEEAQDPAKKEFQRVLAEASLGRPVEAALADMAERIGSKNFAFIVTAVSIQNQVGGSLAGLFDMVADTVRQRQQFSRKIKALTAMGRASAYVLIGLPFFLGALITVISHKYMAPLFFTSSGHIMIMVGLVAMAIGSLILNKIVSFKG
jgi:tight adherence protein B